jgi:hypothetical protein
MGVLLVAGKDNLFTEPSGLAKEGKELQCVISGVFSLEGATLLVSSLE